MRRVAEVCVCRDVNERKILFLSERTILRSLPDYSISIVDVDSARYPPDTSHPGISNGKAFKRTLDRM